MCHPNGRYTGTPTNCVDCHRADYDQTTNPNHQQAGFPTDCETCHGASANSWLGATFDHNLAWPLNGQQRCRRLRLVPSKRKVHRNADQLRGLPSGRLRPNDQSQPSAGGIPNGLRDLPWSFGEQLAGSHVRSQHRLAAQRAAPGRRLRLVPSQRPVHRNANHLCGLPSGRLRPDDQSQPSAGGFPNRLRDLSRGFGEQLAGGDVRSQSRLAAQRAARGRRLRLVSSQRTVHRNANQLCGLPSTRLRPDHESQPSTSRFPDRLRDLSRGLGEQLAGSHIRSQHRLAAQRTAQGRRLCFVPSQRPIHRNANHLCGLSSSRLRPDHESQPPTSRFPDRLRDLSRGLGEQLAGSTFDHNIVWPLNGQHRSADCTLCHPNGRYTGTPTNCVDCHQPTTTRRPIPTISKQDSRPTARPVTELRRTVGWEPHSITTSSGRSTDSTGPPTVLCAIPTAGTPERQPPVWIAINPTYDRTTNPNHLQAGFPTDCETCHGASANSWLGATFDHNIVWPLNGQHRAADCALCHPNGRYTGTPTTCVDCHQADFDQTTNPNHQQAGFPTDCETCHGASANSWLGATFDHNLVWPLNGQHRAADCALCHPNGRYTGTPTNCVDCHQPDYDRTTNPNHLQAGFPTDCETCHGTSANSWLGATFDHNIVWPLNGQHRAADCALCHPNGRYTGTPTNCVDCHQPDYDRTTNPNHLQAGFPTDCETCHGTSANSWLGATFDHNIVWPLNGQHRAADCALCHPNGRYTGTPTNCVDCHRADYDRTTNPNHLQAGFPTDCETCHGTSANSWLGATFDHNIVWPLNGQHRATDCALCHPNGRYTGTPTNCVDCHQPDYDRTTNPNHLQAGFPTDCETCHGTSANSWLGATFDHNIVWPLNGQHRAADCALCHPNGRYTGTPTNCVGCHQVDYDQTTNPNHPQAGFPTDCESCHGSAANTWTGASFDHNLVWTLNGNHALADCSQCHPNGRYTGTPTNCVDCHRADYDGTTNPNHQQAGFPTDCESCHGSAANTWTGASFDHNLVWTLNGNHALANCSQCHPNGRYTGTPTNCVDCHRADYDGTTNPNHQQAGFPTDCESCHGSAASTWLGANFDHNQAFPLQGAHQALDCQVCHSQGYNLPTTCVGCHQSDYDAARNPDHASNGFPTTCENCHFPNHVTWSQAQFDHGFPIDGGPHANAQCSECHVTGNFLNFSCIDCHKHEQTTMDEKHSQVGGYSYNSQACYGCHPNGRK